MKPGASDDRHLYGARERRTAPPGGDTPAPGARRTRSSLVLGGLVLAVVLSTRWVRLNGSPSVPLGLYRLAAVREPLARGALVVLPVPAQVQAWHSRWLPLLKPVAAVAGEAVCVWDEGMWIEGQWYGPVYQHAHDMALPRVRGCFFIQAGEVFLASHVPRSNDSRYFGPVPLATLHAVATPLWTWH